MLWKTGRYTGVNFWNWVSSIRRSDHRHRWKTPHCPLHSHFPCRRSSTAAMNWLMWNFQRPFFRFCFSLLWQICGWAWVRCDFSHRTVCYWLCLCLRTLFWPIFVCLFERSFIFHQPSRAALSIALKFDECVINKHCTRGIAMIIYGLFRVDRTKWPSRWSVMAIRC